MQDKLWTRDFCLVSFSNFFVYVAYYALMVVTAVYALDQLNATTSQAGLAAGIFLVAGLIARFFTGPLLSLAGKKKMMLLGTLLYTGTMLLYSLADNVYLLSGIRFLQGIGFGISTTAMATVAAEILPQKRQGEGLGYFLLSVTLASAVGPFLGLYLYQGYSFWMILYIGLGLAFFSSVFVLLLRLDYVQGTMQAVSKEKGLRKYLEYSAMPIAGIGFLVFLCYSSVIGFLSAYVAVIDLQEAGQYFFLLYSLAILLSRPFVGRLSDTRGTSYVLYPAFIFFAIGLFLVSQAQGNVLFLFSSVFMGIGFGTFSSMGQVVAIQGVAKNRIGVATSTFLAVSELGIGIGPFLLGNMVPWLGFRNLYLLVGIVVLAALLMYHMMQSKTKTTVSEVTR